MKHQKAFDAEDYPNGIPKEEFESLIMEYRPVTAEQIQEYAVFDEIPLDYTINLVESDEFLHLLSEEDTSEEQLNALKHCLEKLPEFQRISIMQDVYKRQE